MHTTEPRSHGEKHKDRWARAEPTHLSCDFLRVSVPPWCKGLLSIEHPLDEPPVFHEILKNTVEAGALGSFQRYIPLIARPGSRTVPPVTGTAPRPGRSQHSNFSLMQHHPHRLFLSGLHHRLQRRTKHAHGDDRLNRDRVPHPQFTFIRSRQIFFSFFLCVLSALCGEILFFFRRERSYGKTSWLMGIRHLGRSH